MSQGCTRCHRCAGCDKPHVLTKSACCSDTHGLCKNGATQPAHGIASPDSHLCTAFQLVSGKGFFELRLSAAHRFACVAPLLAGSKPHMAHAPLARRRTSQRSKPDGQAARLLVFQRRSATRLTALVTQGPAIAGAISTCRVDTSRRNAPAP